MEDFTSNLTCKTPRLERRVLETALSIFIFMSLTFNAKASTVDDLRVLLGGERICTQANEIALSKQITDYETTNNLKSNGITVDINTINAYNQALDDIREKSTELDKSLSKDDANVALGILSEAKTIKDKLGAYGDLSEVSLVTDEEYNEALTKLNYIKDNPELGKIGQELENPISDIAFEVEAPFGQTLDYYNPDQVYNSNGLYIYNNGDSHAVKSLWNGVVQKIVDSPNWGKYLVIQHGGCLTSSISFLSEVSVKLGDEVKAGQTIGKVNGDYIYLEVILDGNYVDPIKLFGTKGKEAYLKWQNEHLQELAETRSYDDIKDLVEEYTENKLNIETNNDPNTFYVTTN